MNSGANKVKERMSRLKSGKAKLNINQQKQISSWLFASKNKEIYY